MEVFDALVERMGLSYKPGLDGWDCKGGWGAGMASGMIRSLGFAFIKIEA